MSAFIYIAGTSIITTDTEAFSVSTSYLKHSEMTTTTNDLNTKEENSPKVSHDVVTTGKTDMSHSLCKCSYSVIPEATLNKMEMEIKVSINTFREKLRLTIDDDHRSSTKGVAAVAVVFISVVFGGIVLSDVWTMVTKAKQHMMHI